MSSAQLARARTARERVAAQKAAAKRADRRRKVIITSASISVVLALVLALVVVKLTESPPRAGATSADAAVTRAIGAIPTSTFNAVGAGTATGLKPIGGGPELVSGGKPEILYMGGEFCPYCAAERWALATAVSRFGTLSNVTFIHSSPTDVYANTPTLSFYRSRYTSRYLSFVPVEWYTETPSRSTPFGYSYLQQPTRQQLALFTKYAGGSVPFVDIGNRFLLPQTQYLPSVLAGLTWSQIAGAMRDPASPIAKDVDGAANILSQAICTMTHGQPSKVCSSPGVKATPAQ